MVVDEIVWKAEGSRTTSIVVILGKQIITFSSSFLSKLPPAAYSSTLMIFPILSPTSSESHELLYHQSFFPRKPTIRHEKFIRRFSRRFTFNDLTIFVLKIGKRMRASKHFCGKENGKVFCASMCGKAIAPIRFVNEETKVLMKQ
jgi:hypothetical protein